MIYKSQGGWKYRKGRDGETMLPSLVKATYGDEEIKDDWLRKCYGVFNRKQFYRLDTLVSRYLGK